MTLPDLHLEEAELDALGQQLGGCDFRGAPQRTFLTASSSCDVQAAPGSGKTTLLVAKLLHLHRRWTNKHSGICVLSHTNAARREVEAKLGTIALSGMAAHPHFVGTVTSFVHRFLALPYLRGLRWPVNKIDNDHFDALATRLVASDPDLSRQWRRKRQFEGFAKRLTISGEFSPGPGLPPARCPIRDLAKLPRPGTKTRNAFERVKGALLREGIYRYDDLTVLAHKALDGCPELAAHIRRRFALILLDEAQDTSDSHHSLLDRIFDGHVIQRLGDCNQTLYDSDASWVPVKGAIDLGTSRRFQQPVAEFASRITARRPQVIAGHDRRDELSLRPTLITFPKDSPHLALSSYSGIVDEELPRDADAWVVSWVHRPTGSKSAVSLQTYAPTYRPPSGPRRSSNTFFDVVSAACHNAQAGASLGGPAGSIRRAVFRLLRRQGLDGLAELKSTWGFRRWLRANAPKVSQDLDELMVAILTTDSAQFAQADKWDENSARLLAVLAPLTGGAALTRSARSFMARPDASGSSAQDVLGVQHLDHRGVRLNLGSIASVKGRTHDATLVVQTTMSGVRDVKTALEVAAGIRRRNGLGTNLLRAVTNVFVGATRPRHLLCLALPGSDLTSKLRARVLAWNWRVVESSE